MNVPVWLRSASWLARQEQSQALRCGHGSTARNQATATIDVDVWVELERIERKAAPLLAACPHQQPRGLIDAVYLSR
jgi:hypothetical protein